MENNEWISIKAGDELPYKEVCCQNKFGKHMVGYIYPHSISSTGLSCEGEDDIMTDVVAYRHISDKEEQ